MRGRTAAFAAAVGLSTIVADPALAHDVPGAERLTERQLQRVEKRLLGRQHAAEHAVTRRVARAERRKWKRMTPAQRRKARRPLATASAGDPATDGRWTSAFDMPVVAVHAAMLPTGKIMIFSQTVHDYRNRAASAYLWDPAKKPGEAGEFEAVPPEDNIWCGGQSLLSDGQLLVTGGNLSYGTATTGFAGLNTVFTFDPWTKRWTRQPDMRTGRWYPTQTLLPDGRTLITSGYDEFGGYVWNKDIDVFKPPAQRGGRGSIETIARYGELRGAPSVPHWYPHWFVMPSGKVLNAGFTTDQSFVLDTTPGAVRAEDRPDWLLNRKYGSAVLLPGATTGSTRVMMLGGYNHRKGGDVNPDPEVTDYPATAETEVYDEATPGIPSKPGPRMLVPRQSHNTVILPDESLVNIGGGSGEMESMEAPSNANNALAVAGPEHRAIEILDPGSSAWRLGPSQAYKRAYHSTALLLPDGRVLSAGDDRDPQRPDWQRTDKAEIYEPAYLFKPGPRPQITSAPDGVAFGESFSIATSSPVSKAVLIAPGAVTHANNMSQRLIALNLSARSDGMGADLVAPANANVAPPGYYMLFALSPNGKPSVAKWVYVGQSRPSTSPPVSGSGVPVTPAKPEPPQQADTTAPRAAVRITTRARTLRRNGRLTFALQVDERADVRVSAKLEGRGGRTLRAPRRGSQRVVFHRGRTQAVTLKLARADRRRLVRGTVRGTVRVVAKDPAGNRKARTLRIELR